MRVFLIWVSLWFTSCWSSFSILIFLWRESCGESNRYGLISEESNMGCQLSKILVKPEVLLTNVFVQEANQKLALWVHGLSSHPWAKQIWIGKRVQPACPKILLCAKLRLSAPRLCRSEAPLLDMTTPQADPAQFHLKAFPCWRSPDSPIVTWRLIFQPKDLITLWKLTTSTFLWQLSTLIWSSNLASTGISQSPPNTVQRSLSSALTL